MTPSLLKMHMHPHMRMENGGSQNFEEDKLMTLFITQQKPRVPTYPMIYETTGKEQARSKTLTNHPSLQRARDIKSLKGQSKGSASA